MGNKVNPKMFRTGVIFPWNSKWFGGRKDYARLLCEDVGIRKFLWAKLKECSLDHIDIERTSRAITVTVHSAKPGFIIGRGGQGIEDLKKQIKSLVLKGRGRGGEKEKLNLNLNVVEVSNPSTSSHVVMQSMIADLEKRLPFRRVLKQHLDRIQKAGAKGAKLQVKGRLNGAEIAREEKLSWGSVPLHNLRADIDYASGFASTLMGTIGVKVWIYRGEVFDGEGKGLEAAASAASRPPMRRRPLPMRPAR